jgi:hypothetical protein
MPREVRSGGNLPCRARLPGFGANRLPSREGVGWDGKPRAHRVRSWSRRNGGRAGLALPKLGDSGGAGASLGLGAALMEWPDAV